MKTCVAYESMYGNTHLVAEAIGTGLARLGDIRVGSISEIDPESLADVDLLVVGGPTHVHGLSRESTRQAAVEEAEADDEVELDADAPGPGLRDWLRRLPPTTGRTATANAGSFDTRIDKPVILVGSAAKGIARQLRKHGYGAPLDPESFFVDGSTGPLHEGELDRARRWGVELAHEVARINR